MGCNYEQIFIARVKLLLRQWPIVWGGNLLAQTVSGYVLWGYFPASDILLWCGSNYLLFFIRLYLRVHFDEQVETGYHAVRRWAHQYAGSALIGGLIWGSGAWLFFDISQPELTIFMLIVLVSVIAAALPALSSYSPAFFCFSIGITIPLVMKLINFDWAHSDYLALLAVMFLGINLVYSRNLDKTISSSITMDLKNKSLLADMTAMRDRAEQANVQKSRFLAAVSHDLRQPLHAMGLFMSSLKMELKSEKQLSLYEHIDQARESLIEMFDALLDVSRLETGRIKPVIRHCQLAPVIEEVVSAFSVQAAEKNIAIRVEDCLHVVKTDAVLLAGIIRNLLHNAIKYTDRGTITVECRRLENEIELAVRDTGCGIPAEQQDRIFDEYHQLNNPRRDRDNGLGLGLSIVKKTASLLNHELTLDSAPEKGSCFCIRLPTGQADHIEEEKAIRLAQNFSSLNVLVIDDDRAVREATSMLLSDWGYRAITCATLPKALERIRSEQCVADLLICDYRLGNNLHQSETGLDAVVRIREECDRHLPALIITADTHQDTLRTIADNELLVLKKPISPARLKNIINTLLAAG